MASATPYDAILLDVMLRGIDGFEVCRRLRAGRRLDARADADRTRLRARPRRRPRRGCRRLPHEAVLRSRSCSRGSAPSRVVAGRSARPWSRSETLRLDPAARRAWRGDVELDLSSREFAVLELLMRSPGLALTRLQILDGAWDMAFEGRSNIVDVYMRYLREKVDRPFGCASIETVRGVGYRLREDGG